MSEASIGGHMHAKRAEEIEGVEYDWLGCDCEGHVALFTTAGRGYAPPEFLADIEGHEDAIAAILAGPGDRGVLRAPQLSPGYENTWREAALRGLFAFDADPNCGVYRLVALPGRPVKIDELSSKVAAAIAKVVFPRICFSKAQELSTAELRGLRK